MRPNLSKAGNQFVKGEDVAAVFRPFSWSDDSLEIMENGNRSTFSSKDFGVIAIFFKLFATTRPKMQIKVNRRWNVTKVSEKISL